MNSLALGGVLKRIYEHFDMQSFSNRLRVQKVIYLLQGVGINLGYSYSWYIYGPYSTGLTRDAFQITNFKNVKPIGFVEPSTEKKFQEFTKKIKQKNDFWLEVASSIHFLKELYPNKTKSSIINEIQNKRTKFNNKKDKILQVWEDIEGWII
ncbi:MAG: hypothetical protein ISS25_00555 [Nanoarchaeota archaeon]|nr:hypothetical protein [DPANN group archaeon]MBL7116307.1 hypothetical protein [Nanoarchaeota archaeon]